jgi:chromosome segregation ATPase
MASRIQVQHALSVVRSSKAMTTAESVDAMLKALNLEQSSVRVLLNQLFDAEQRYMTSVRNMAELQGQIQSLTSACVAERGDKGMLSTQLQAAHNQTLKRDQQIAALKDRLSSVQRSVDHLTAQLESTRVDRDEAAQSAKAIKQAMTQAQAEHMVRCQLGAMIGYAKRSLGTLGSLATQATLHQGHGFATF